MRALGLPRLLAEKNLWVRCVGTFGYQSCWWSGGVGVGCRMEHHGSKFVNVTCSNLCQTQHLQPRPRPDRWGIFLASLPLRSLRRNRLAAILARGSLSLERVAPESHRDLGRSGDPWAVVEGVDGSVGRILVARNTAGHRSICL